jgi:hypothetical protein
MQGDNFEQEKFTTSSDLERKGKEEKRLRNLSEI